MEVCHFMLGVLGNDRKKLGKIWEFPVAYIMVTLSLLSYIKNTGLCTLLKNCCIECLRLVLRVVFSACFHFHIQFLCMHSDKQTNCLNHFWCNSHMTHSTLRALLLVFTRCYFSVWILSWIVCKIEQLMYTYWNRKLHVSISTYSSRKRFYKAAAKTRHRLINWWYTCIVVRRYSLPLNLSWI